MNLIVENQEIKYDDIGKLIDGQQDEVHMLLIDRCTIHCTYRQFVNIRTAYKQGKAGATSLFSDKKVCSIRMVDCTITTEEQA